MTKGSKTSLSNLSKKKLWGIRYLRPALTYPLRRSLLRIPTPPPGLEISLAHTQSDLEACYRLIYKVYLEYGMTEPHPSEMRLSVYNMLPHFGTIMAKIQGEVVGTLSILRDNPLGLPLNETLDSRLYRKTGWQVAELLHLAVAPSWRGQGQVLFPLLKFAYEYAIHGLKVDIFQVVSPLDKEEFLRSILFFEPISEAIFRDPMLNGTLVTALYLDLNHARSKFKRAYGTKSPAKNLESYFTGLKLPNFKFPTRDLHQTLDPCWTPDLFRYFFKDKTNLVDRLSDHEVHVLRDLYQNTPIVAWLRAPHSVPPYPPRRKAPRFSVNCPALIESEEGDEPVLLVDVSDTGFRLFSKMPLRLTDLCHLRVHISPSQTLPVKAKPVWNQRRREWGFILIEAPTGWKKFISTLETQIKGEAPLTSRKKNAA